MGIEKDLLRYIAEQNQAEIEVFKEDLARGAAENYACYKESCGIIRGLMVANRILADADAKLLREDGDVE